MASQMIMREIVNLENIARNLFNYTAITLVPLSDDSNL